MQLTQLWQFSYDGKTYSVRKECDGDLRCDCLAFRLHKVWCIHLAFVQQQETIKQLVRSR